MSAASAIASTTPASTAIGLACDDHYAPHAAAALLSLLSHTAGRDLELLLSSLSSLWAERLQTLVSSCGAQLQLASRPDQISVPHASAAALLQNLPAPQP